MKKFADFNVSHFLSTLYSTATWLIADCIYDVTQTSEKKKGKKEKKGKREKKIGTRDKERTTIHDPIFPDAAAYKSHDSTFEKKVQAISEYYDLIVESSISASHNKTRMYNPTEGQRKHLTDLTGVLPFSADCTRLLTSYYHLGRWSVASGTSFESRFKNLVTYPFVIVIIFIHLNSKQFSPVFTLATSTLLLKKKNFQRGMISIRKE